MLVTLCKVLAGSGQAAGQAASWSWHRPSAGGALARSVLLSSDARIWGLKIIDTIRSKKLQDGPSQGLTELVTHTRCYWIHPEHTLGRVDASVQRLLKPSVQRADKERAHLKRLRFSQ